MLYEKALGVKAEVMRYKDAPQENGYVFAEDTGNMIMHAGFEIGGAVLMVCDMPPEYPSKTGSNIGIMAEFDDAEAAKKAFDVLKEGGEVEMELQETFWSKCFGSLTDRFGIAWNISGK